MKTYIASFIIAIALTAAAAVAGAPAAPTLQKVDAPGITNFTRVDGARTFAGTHAGLGGATKPEAMPWLRREGFVTVINLRSAAEEGADIDASRAAAEAAGLNYIHLPFNPGDTDSDVINNFLAMASDEAMQPVYIHCSSATRAAALWMIGRVAGDGVEIGAASEEAEAIAPRPADAIAIATKHLTPAKDPSGP